MGDIMIETVVSFIAFIVFLALFIYCLNEQMTSRNPPPWYYFIGLIVGFLGSIISIIIFGFNVYEIIKRR